MPHVTALRDECGRVTDGRRRACVLGLLAMLQTAVAKGEPTSLKRIGVLANVPPAANGPNLLAALEGTLRDLGWVPGRNVAYEYRYAMQHTERYEALAAELVAMHVDVLVVPSGVTAALAARRVTSSVPIVAIGVADPVKYGLVESYGRPGGNVTGTVAPVPEWGKYLELVHEALPGVMRVAVIGNSNNVVYADYAADNEKAARRLGLRLQMIGIASVDGFDAAFESMRRERAEALVFGPDGMFASNVREVMRRAQAQRLPVIGPFRPAIADGAILAYGPDLLQIVRQGASYVDRILRGTKPAELPIEQATRFELLVNQKAARELGVTLPRSLLVRADEVVE